ncbi:hypothetical protein Agabi119p4_140 [Agaricus bisporus var. burnettii]|uniref:Uncharacterized protein n=1 Tax=Agaricus bisporus var. burnettii TaxID=192524 RepID=A0A8H7F9Y3_AGABI|nr:hypothetical protein Agabi119p4_140 [Agaricus bisporus var. burnettii]
MSFDIRFLFVYTQSLKQLTSMTWKPKQDDQSLQRGLGGWARVWDMTGYGVGWLTPIRPLSRKINQVCVL